MASAFCGLPTHMVRVAIWSFSPLHRRLFGDVQGDVARGRQQTHTVLGVGHSYGGCMDLVMTAVRVGLGKVNAAIRKLESPKKNLLI